MWGVCLSRGIEGTCSKIIFFFPSCFSRFWEKSQKATFYTIIFKIVIFQQFQLVVSVPVSNRETDTAMFLVKMEEAELPLTDGIIFDLSSLYHPVHRPVDRRLQWRKVYASKVVFVDSWSTNCLIWTKYSPQPHQLLPPDLHRVAEIENWDWFKFNIGDVHLSTCPTWGVDVVQFQHWVLSMRSTREGFVEAMLVTNMITTKVFAIPILNFSCYSFVRAPAFSFVRSYLVSGTTQTNLLLAGGQNFIIWVFAFSQGLLAFWQPLLFSLVLSCFFTWLEKLSASWNLSSVYFPCFWLPGFCLCCFLCSCFQRLLFLAVEWLWLHWSRPAGVPLTLAPPHLHRSAMHKTKF